MVSAKGEVSALDIEYAVGSEALLELDVREEAEASYNVEFLSEIVDSGYKIDDIADLEYASNMPLKLTFSLVNGKVEYYLAPYVE
jgi:proliferating cell nuclear antigen